VAVTLALGVSACSLGDDLDVASRSPVGEAGTSGAGGQSAVGSGGSSGGPSVTNPACAVPGSAATLGQGTARLDLTVPAQSTWDLTGGMFGQVVQDGEVRNRKSHVDYGRGPRTLSVGIEGGDNGAILALGPDADVASRVAAVAPCTGFDRLALIGRAFNDPSAASLFTATPKTSAGAAAVVGHVYVLRIVRKSESDIIAKLLVTAVEDQSVSFAWVNLAPPPP